MTDKATPRPWALDDRFHSHRWRIYGTEDQTCQGGDGPHNYKPCICEGARWPDSDPHEESAANAALIVRAVNRDHLFDEMVAALEAYQDAAISSYCEFCEQHAPKDDNGYLAGSIEHRPTCPHSCARAILAKIDEASS